jgi:hydrogenase maturation protease
VSAAPAVVIGVGNPYRRDDAVGPVLLSRLERVSLPGVALATVDGDPTQLLDAWVGRRLAIVVDAVLCDRGCPGRVHRVSLDLPPGTRTAASTHGLGVPDAIRLAQVLDRAPRRLVVLAVEAADLGMGPGLSPEVRAALPALTATVLRELAGAVSEAEEPTDVSG